MRVYGGIGVGRPIANLPLFAGQVGQPLLFLRVDVLQRSLIHLKRDTIRHLQEGQKVHQSRRQVHLQWLDRSFPQQLRFVLAVHMHVLIKDEGLFMAQRNGGQHH